MLVSFTNYSFNLLMPLYCPLTNPGAHTLLSNSSMPTLHELGKLTVDRVASQWEEVASHLMVESCGICINGPGHPEEASRGALSRWLKGESDSNIAEKTRCSVLESQEASRNIPLEEQQKFFEESFGEPVTGFACPPGMCVFKENIWILFVNIICCNALNTCQWLFLDFRVRAFVLCAVRQPTHNI